MNNRDVLDLLARPRGSLLGSLLDAAPVGASLALDGRVAYANPACARMFGYARPDDMLEVSFFVMIAPESRDFVQKLWHARLDDTGEPWVYEIVGLRPSGEPFPYRCSSVSFTLSDGKKATFAFFEDLSDERPNEQHLRRSSEQLLADLGM